MTAEEARLLLEAQGLDGVVSPETVARTETYEREKASPAKGRSPLVLLSPGFSMPRATLTSLADELTSCGYVVASGDHAYESVGTAFPGGRVLTCVACERVDTDEEQAEAGLGRRPFMMLGTESLHSPGSAGTDWPGAWEQLAGWRRWLTVTGAGHFSFTDLPYLADQLGLSDPAVPLSAEQGWRISRDYTGAFFDLHLRGIPQPLLDGPTAAYPEVAFCRP